MRSRAAGMGLVLAASLAAMLAAGCSLLPKVTVIDDPLSKEEHYALGLTYEGGGQMDLAEREYGLALPLAEARLAMGNLAWQVRGDASEAMGHYRLALARDSIPAAANNLAWLILVEGGSLDEAKEWAALAVEEALRRREPDKTVANYRSTLAQIEAAIKAARQRR